MLSPHKGTIYWLSYSLIDISSGSHIIFKADWTLKPMLKLIFEVDLEMVDIVSSVISKGVIEVDFGFISLILIYN